MQKHRMRLLAVVLALAHSLSLSAATSSQKDILGFKVTDDYVLATYTQFETYVKKIASESKRTKLVEMGKTEEGRTQYMLIMSSPENIQNIEKYKDISRRMAYAEGLNDAQARALAKEGKAVVWIDGGLHATEVLGAAQLIETIDQLANREDEETLRFLRDCVILLVHANPDGMELVSSNYMRESDPQKRRYVAERLYQKYVGHDNNRDFYMNTQKETRNISEQLFRQWVPQILYNHHQTGPIGTVMFAPPFRDPANYVYDPLLMLGIDQVGAAMHTRFAMEDKPGVTTREGASYSVWYNGGLRTTANFHNIIGILTETIGSPTPMSIPFVPERMLMSKTMPFPITPQATWHFRQSIEYEITANRAILDYASKHREDLLLQIYKMGKNGIDKGNRDTWTMIPSRVADVQAKIAKERGASTGMTADAAVRFGGGVTAATKYFDELRLPEFRDPRGYILSANQPDFATAVKFIQILQQSGVVAHRASADFTVEGKQYPKGSIVVKTAQAFRPHVLDLFEPQNHPNEFRYPGGPPIAPYDSAGWTLAMQMGIKFDRILNGFEGPFERLASYASFPEGQLSGPSSASGYLLSHKVNDSFKAINKLLAAGEQVYWLKQPFTANGVQFEQGTIYVPAKASTRQLLQASAKDFGLNITAVAEKPKGDALKLKPIRVGLWDNVGGSMSSGWTRWLFEQYGYPFEVVYPPTLDKGDLRAKYDVLVFVTGAIAETRRGGGGAAVAAGTPPLSPEWQARSGRVTREKTLPSIQKFLESGGTVLTIGSSTALAEQLGLPLANHLVEKTSAGVERRLPQDKFYVPGSLVEVAIDNSNPLAYGMDSKASIFFDDSPVFRLKPDAAMKKVNAVAWFDSASPLRSGWAWGQSYLEGGVAVAEAKVGEGKLFLYGPEVMFRAQPHGTFKLFFNALHYGTAEAATLP